MNENLFHSPDIRGELEARRERVRHDVSLSRAGQTPAGQRSPLRGGLAGIAALLGSPVRHRAA
jgi:hypothetical protein